MTLDEMRQAMEARCTECDLNWEVTIAGAEAYYNREGAAENARPSLSLAVRSEDVRGDFGASEGSSSCSWSVVRVPRRPGDGLTHHPHWSREAFDEFLLAVVHEQVSVWAEGLARPAYWDLVRGPSQHTQSESLGSDRWCLYFYTGANKYCVVAAPDYLGCVATSRKPRAGESWTRGNDLPDGPFDEATWRAIIAGVVGYETVRIHQVREEPPDQVARDDPLVTDDQPSA